MKSNKIIIKLLHCTKIYNNNDKKIVALNDVSCTFKLGKMYAICGHSGSGKTTLLNLISTIDIPSSGDVIFDNVNIKKLTSLKKANYRNENIGFIYQDYLLIDDMSVKENIMLPMLINNKILPRNREKKVDDLLNSVKLSDKKNTLPKNMSGGEQQRVAIARALANNPKIILADEPTGNLDIDNEKLILEFLKDLSKMGKCVIVVSHSPEIINYADDVVNFKKGELYVKK